MANQDTDIKKVNSPSESEQPAVESTNPQNNPLLSVKTAKPITRFINFSDESKKEKKEKNDD